MCSTLMRSVTHDGSFLWMFGEDTRAVGRFADVRILRFCVTHRILGKTLTHILVRSEMFLGSRNGVSDRIPVVNVCSQWINISSSKRPALDASFERNGE